MGIEVHPLVAEHEDDPLLTPGELAEIYRINPKTVARWVKRYNVEHVKTLGGHLRIRKSWMEKAIEANMAAREAREAGRDHNR